MKHEKQYLRNKIRKYKDSLDNLLDNNLIKDKYVLIKKMKSLKIEIDLLTNILNHLN